MLQNTRAAKQTYALKTPADFKAKILETSLIGMSLQLDGEQVQTRMIGAFNASNLTAAYGVARLLGVEKMEALTALSTVTGAEGRFDYLVHPEKTGAIGVVDYAHTPDALEKVIDTIRQLKKPSAKLITVVGCGGDRDKTKRPVMARVAARGSEHLILTSDNPRTEDPAAILRDMQEGLTPEDEAKTLVIQDREQAIKTACRLLGNGDVVLVAGKGHEKYQDVNGVKHPFDDKAVLGKSFGIALPEA
jgi:UDP-N-acetylmuramoyl-L-alanyl-D-glutamate--2,6-diaminopimelate ligase